MIDSKAAASGTAGGITALLGFFSINDMAAIIGIITAVVTCSVYVWSAKKRVDIQEEMKKEQKDHHEQMRDLHREDEKR